MKIWGGRKKEIIKNKEKRKTQTGLDSKSIKAL